MSTAAVCFHRCPNCGNMTLRKNGGAAGSKKQRWVCRNGGGERAYCYSTTNPDTALKGTRAGARPKAPRVIRNLRGKKRFLVTAAQNATPVHEGFLLALEKCALETERELIVIPLRYKNPTSRWPASQRNDEVWAPELDKYCYNRRKKLNDNIVLLGDIKTQPTAETPLTGFEGLSHGESAILGHTKLQLKTVPVPRSRFPKLLTTTGAVTQPNYTDTKAGKKGEFHHVLGAAVVDIDGKTFHLRQINAAKDGSFIDLDHEFYPDKLTTEVDEAASLTCGDTHVGESDPAVIAARAELIEQTNPSYIVHHDLHNGRSTNPHEVDNPFVQLAMHRGGQRNVRKEIEDAVRFLRSMGNTRTQIIVASNHNDFLARWLNTHDWRRDPENADFYLETAAAVARSAMPGVTGPEYDDAFTHWMRRLLKPEDNVQLPSRGDSVMIAGIEHNFHGDKGPNGARGSVLNMSKLGVKVNIGHVHAPAILGPLYAAGTSTYLDPPYTRGHPGGWLNTDILTYRNGKRTLINYIGGKYRL
jgi:hypothetical protein